MIRHTDTIHEAPEDNHIKRQPSKENLSYGHSYARAAYETVREGFKETMTTVEKEDYTNVERPQRVRPQQVRRHYRQRHHIRKAVTSAGLGRPSTVVQEFRYNPIRQNSIGESVFGKYPILKRRHWQTWGSRRKEEEKKESITYTTSLHQASNHEFIS